MPVKSFFNYLTHKDKYKIIYIFIIILSLYGYYVLGSHEYDAIKSILIAFQFDLFNLFFFIITFLTTMYVVDTFNNDFSNAIIRFKNKKKYLLNMVIINIVMFLYNLFLFSILFFTLVIINKFSTTEIVLYNPYNINSLTYVVFYIFRYFLLLLGLNILSLYIYLNFGKVRTAIFQMTILLCLGASLFTSFKYFVYSNFSSDFIVSIIKITVLMVIILCFHFYSLKKGKIDIT